MNTYECILTRRSSRAFLDTPVEQEKLDKIIEAGRYAPSGGNCQSAHLVVIKNRQILNRLAELVQQEFAEMEPREGLYKSLLNSIQLSRRGNYRFHYDPPILIVVTNQKGYGNAMADSACCLQNMMLMANELDLGSCWINQLHWLEDSEVLRQEFRSLGISDAETVCGAVAIGYARKLNRSTPPRTGNPVTVIE